MGFLIKAQKFFGVPNATHWSNDKVAWRIHSCKSDKADGLFGPSSWDLCQKHDRKTKKKILYHHPSILLDTSDLRDTFQVPTDVAGLRVRLQNCLSASCTNIRPLITLSKEVNIHPLPTTHSFVSC